MDDVVGHQFDSSRRPTRSRTEIAALVWCDGGEVLQRSGVCCVAGDEGDVQRLQSPVLWQDANRGVDLRQRIIDASAGRDEVRDSLDKLREDIAAPRRNTRERSRDGNRLHIEARHDCKIIPSALERPEEIRIRRRGHLDDAAIGQDSLVADDGAEGPSVQVPEIVDPAAQQEPPDAHFAVAAAGDGEAERCDPFVDVGPALAGADLRDRVPFGEGLGVEVGHADHDARVRGLRSRHGHVAAAADGEGGA